MFLDRDELRDKILANPFPDGVKVRISITGLSFCELDKDSSKISFLRHVKNHELAMTVIQRERNSAANTTFGPFEIDEVSPVEIKVTNSIRPAKIREVGAGVIDLEKIINVSRLHGDLPIDSVELPLGKPRPSDLIIPNCSFYTLDYFAAGCFELIQTGMGSGVKNELGFILGGNIRCTSTNSNLTITFTGPMSGNLRQPLKGMISGKEMVYDVIFNNHCTDLVKCEAEVATMGGTDFSFYYNVLKERGSSGRTFYLKKLKPCRGTQPPLIASDIAACNPVIKFPKPPGYDI
jgi:hypothetical protein